MNKEVIGNFIGECRAHNNLTQTELGEKINISKSTISNWENGKSLPEVSIMPKLCEALNITVNELISGERIDDKNYIKKAEANLLKLKKQEEANNRVLIGLKTLIQIICTMAFIIMTAIGFIIKTASIYRVILILTGGLIFIINMCYTVKIDKEINRRQ